MPTPPRPFQFTLRRMFAATAYVSAGFALAAVVMRVWHTQKVLLNQPFDGLIAFLGPFAVLAMLALMGAGFGELCGDVMKGAERGVIAGVVLFTLGTFVWVATTVIWRIP